MKVQRIENVNTHRISKQNCASFKGYVNGKFYEDHIIDMAKKALKDSNWEKNLRKERSNLNGYLNWHEGTKDQGGLTTRILAAGLSFGLSEVLVGGVCAIGAALDDTDKMISNIKDCMVDLLKSGKG